MIKTNDVEDLTKLMKKLSDIEEKKTIQPTPIWDELKRLEEKIQYESKTKFLPKSRKVLNPEEQELMNIERELKFNVINHHQKQLYELRIFNNKLTELVRSNVDITPKELSVELGEDRDNYQQMIDYTVSKMYSPTYYIDIYPKIGRFNGIRGVGVNFTPTGNTNVDFMLTQFICAYSKYHTPNGKIGRDRKVTVDRIEEFIFNITGVKIEVKLNNDDKIEFVIVDDKQGE